MAHAAIVPASPDSEDAPPRSARTAHAIINLRAGTALGLAPDHIHHTVERAFQAQGCRITVDCPAAHDLEPAIARAAKTNIDALIVGGGDGTIRTAARHLMGRRAALGILPLGTMNRLAKDLDIPLDLRQAAQALARATPSRIDVATVNGALFLCNSLMGATLPYSVARARMRGRPVLVRLPKYFAIIRNLLASRRKISIEVDNGKGRLRIRALSVAVTNNGYDETTPWLRRPKLDEGKLTLYVSKHQSGWGLAKALARALIGRWHGDPEMAKLTGTAFLVHAPLRRARLANDGEIGKFATPLEYKVVPRALRVLTSAGYDDTPPSR